MQYNVSVNVKYTFFFHSPYISMPPTPILRLKKINKNPLTSLLPQYQMLWITLWLASAWVSWSLPPVIILTRPAGISEACRTFEQTNRSWRLYKYKEMKCGDLFWKLKVNEGSSECEVSPATTLKIHIYKNVIDKILLPNFYL